MNPDQKWFEYNGKKSTDFGIWISGDGTLAGAEPDIESIEIPGRNGSLTLWNGRYRNVSVYYRCFITKYFMGQFGYFRNWLLHDPGYHKLTDNYHTQYFRQARVLSGLDISSIEWTGYGSGTFTVRFDCMPQRFTDYGDDFQELFNSGDPVFDGYPINSVYYDTKPIIATRGYGKVTIDYGDNHENPISFTIAQNSFTYDLYTDCELENCYANATTMVNRNSYLTLDDGKFPILRGDVKNYVTFDNTFTRVRVKPRWFRL